MDSVHLSRRSLLEAIAATMISAAVPSGWADIAHALHAPDPAGPAGDPPKLRFLSVRQAADVEAVAAHIIPTDDTPGAREAGVVYFIDRALATFFSQLAHEYRSQLSGFQNGYRTQYSAAESFAALTPAQQVDYLHAVEQTAFFNTTRLLTLLGMFSRPAYGGNRDNTGWALLGFEDAHVFHPPFGYYDREYPGFAIDLEKVR